MSRRQQERDRERVRDIRSREDVDYRPIRAARTRAKSEAKAPDAWTLFDASHPLERMRLSRRRPLGADEERADLRYRAGRVFIRDYEVAHGLTGGGEELGVYVDRSLRPGAGEVVRLEAQAQRARLLRAPGMTRERFALLDAVLGEGRTIAESARSRRQHHSSVAESFIRGLDLLVRAYDYERLQEVEVRRIYPLDPKKGS